ncbi:ferritin-like domain-containing protein [Hymenobacter cheonanensis]|uniref:ferritin-like domain-containing protein n=1 Tax=Hymenobacter sp. CA2-7 TaxID=3063993 RepID=UPI002713239B|nr:ferritin-like domain-containing protein [Hymenobacter sp. CA2-7]MDO7885226.1 ferritin-like domain-containing protein [Hymenobacter sp. CA2-7]
MNFLQILADIEQVDPEVYGRLDSRRAVFKNLGGLGRQLTAAALPLAVGAIFNKAYAQTPVGATVADVLNFALKLEYLEMYFYQRRTAVTGLSAVNAAALALIATDEANHVAFLRSVITSLGSTAVADPGAATFDFTAGGIFSPTVAGQYLALAQAFEDTGVRAYKGAAQLLISNKAVLTAALGIHAVEARHASHIREMRRAGAASTAPSQGVPINPFSNAPKSWVSGLENGGPVPGFTDPVYGAGNNTNAPTDITFLAENTVVQRGIVLSDLPNTSTFPANAFFEAFDEGLDVGTVSGIAKKFLAPGSTFFG